MMDEIALRNRCCDVMRQGLEDEGVLTFDQATAIGRAIMGVVDVLLSSGALASGTLTEGGDVKQAPGDSLSGPTLEEGDAQGTDHD